MPAVVMNVNLLEPNSNRAFIALSPGCSRTVTGHFVELAARAELAINTTLGVWAPRTNKAMIAANRRALAKLQARGIVVRFRHVRAHAGHFMNGRADSLAGFSHAS